MKRTVLGVTLAALAVAGTSVAMVAVAQDMPARGTMDVSKVSKGTYDADPGHTLVGWRVNHLGFNDYFGLFGDAQGTLTLDPANMDATSVDIRIPIAKVTVASEGLKDHLLRAGKDGAKADFFGPEPGMAHFVSDKVTRFGSTRALISGTLEMSGQKHPVVLDTHFTGVGASPMGGTETIGFEATTTIERSRWGIEYGIPLVSDAVELDITAAFEKQ